MDTSEHNLSTLFAQLGLPSDESSIKEFIAKNKSLAESDELADAGFWNSAQSTFLREAIADDSDWAEVVDQLDALLRH